MRYVSGFYEAMMRHYCWLYLCILAMHLYIGTYYSMICHIKLQFENLRCQSFFLYNMVSLWFTFIYLLMPFHHIVHSGNN